MAELLRYTTLREEAHVTFEEKKSVFIGHAAPAATEAEALAFLNRIRAEYPDATHNVYAYVLRENNTVRYSDDREPQGTAGMPTLDVLRKREITDAVIVVTRYFGGTLLGTGGLVHAYSHAAKLAADAAGVVLRARLALCKLTCQYNEYQKILPFLQGEGVSVTDTLFTDTVTLSLRMLYERREDVARRLVEYTNGRVSLDACGETFDFLE
jgi:uncharacterized YigZ family protein